MEAHEGCVRAAGCWSRFPKPSCPEPWESAVRTSASPPSWSACRSKSWPRERLHEGPSEGTGATSAPDVLRGAAPAMDVLRDAAPAMDVLRYAAPAIRALPGAVPVMGNLPGEGPTGGAVAPAAHPATTGRAITVRVPRGTIGRGGSQQPVAKPTRRSTGDASRLNRASPRRSSLRFGRNTLGIPPSRALSAGRLARLGAHVGFTTGR